MHTLKFLKNQLAFVQDKYFIILLSGLILLALFSSTNLMAQGNLMVFPRRVVFEGSKRSQTLNLANTGMDTARYNISFVQYRMKEDGSFEEIAQPDSGENFADKYIRFFPVVLSLPQTMHKQ